jgi:hypothetical protein
MSFGGTEAELIEAFDRIEKWLLGNPFGGSSRSRVQES